MFSMLAYLDPMSVRFKGHYHFHRKKYC